MSIIDEVVFNITWSVMELPQEAKQMSEDLVWYILTGRESIPMLRKLKGMKRKQMTTMFRKLGTRIRSTDKNIQMLKHYMKVE